MKSKIFKVVALVFVIMFSLNFIAMFFMNISFLSMSKIFETNENDDYIDVRIRDSIKKLENNVIYYSNKLDSIMEINPLQAELFADKLLLKYKENEEFLRYKANALFYQKKFQETINVYNQKLNNKKRISDDEFNIGICFENLKKYDSAIYYFHKTKYIDFSSEYRIASCYEKCNNVDSAIVYYKNVLKNIEKRENALRTYKDTDFLKFKIDSLKKTK